MWYVELFAWAQYAPNLLCLGVDSRSVLILVLCVLLDVSLSQSEIDLIRELNLDYIVDNPWVVIPCSGLKLVNIPQIVTWLMAQNNLSN